MVSKTFNIGDIILSTWYKEHEDTPEKISTYAIVGKKYVFSFVSTVHFSVQELADYKMDTDSVVVSNPSTISYLRQKSRDLVDMFLQECQEGILDD